MALNTSTSSPSKTWSRKVTASRNVAPEDNGVRLVNMTANNVTLTVPADGLEDYFDVAMIQGSTGTITVAAAGGVTFIGATLSTTNAGDIISVIWTDTDTYTIKVN